jgi:hypothetical protein
MSYSPEHGLNMATGAPSHDPPPYPRKVTPDGLANAQPPIQGPTNHQHGSAAPRVMPANVTVKQQICHGDLVSGSYLHEQERNEEAGKTPNHHHMLETEAKQRQASSKTLGGGASPKYSNSDGEDELPNQRGAVDQECSLPTVSGLGIAPSAPDHHTVTIQSNRQAAVPTRSAALGAIVEGAGLPAPSVPNHDLAAVPGPTSRVILTGTNMASPAEPNGDQLLTSNGGNPDDDDDFLHEAEVQEGMVLLQELLQDEGVAPGFDRVRQLLVRTILWEEALTGPDKNRLVLMCTSPTVTMVDLIRAASQVQAARAVLARYDDWDFM